MFLKKRDFVVIKRTYGMGAPNVLAATEYISEGHHLYHPKSIPLHVYLQPGRINRNIGGTRRLFELPSGRRCNNKSGIISMLNLLARVWGFVDEF